MTKKYDIFLFDADNTLYDFNKAEANALKIMFDYCGFNYTKGILARYREISAPVWDSYEKNEISLEELQTLRFVRLFTDIGVFHDADDFNTRYLAELGKGAFLIDGALEICREISANNKQIFIITNGIQTTQKSKIKYSPIKDYITDFFVSEFVGHRKPERAYFEYVLSHIPQVEKDRILIVGDSLTADIAGGNNTGIDTCWFNEHECVNNTNIVPVYEIRALSQIQRFI